MADSERTSVLKSPLRYPGGKGSFYPYVAELFRQNGLVGGRYFEPFAGGAGVGLGLLSTGVASEITLNDADFHIFCFWKATLNENERFLSAIESTAISIREWRVQKCIYANPGSHTTFEIGFSTFYLNRCNRSGILAGAGPIGGYGQGGKWTMEARFNKVELAGRIAQIAPFKGDIRIENQDAVEFLRGKLPSGRPLGKSLVFLDPPYVSAGQRLYLSMYSPNDHGKLAKYLASRSTLKWLATYDNHELIRKLYSRCQLWPLNIGYSLQAKLKGSELLIAPAGIKLPSPDVVACGRWALSRQV